MKKSAILMTVCVMVWSVRSPASVVDLGRWSGDKSYQAVLADEGSGGTPVHASQGCQFFAGHIYMAKWAYMDEVLYQFTAASSIIDSVKVDLDQFDWNPEASSGNTMYINVNGTVTHSVSLPASGQSGNLGYATVSFTEPVDTVTIRIQRYLRWGGDDQGDLNIYEGAGGSTPWVFHAVPEPATMGLLVLGGLILRRKNFKF